MFTGLVESTVEVLELVPIEGGARLVLDVPFEGVKLGDSIAVNGCCLTVSSMEGSRFSFDVMAQTVRVTSLGDLEKGSLVNLERAVTAGTRMGGHFVQGHVDDTGIVRTWEPQGQDYHLVVEIPERLCRYCIDKGSLAIDGISLTIASLNDRIAEFWITPHTIQNTHLQKIGVGRRVNLEVDVLAKYVEKLFGERVVRN